MAQLKSTSVVGNLAVTGNVVASQIIKNNGTEDEFLMADGSTKTLDDIGLSGEYIPLSGTKTNHPVYGDIDASTATITAALFSGPATQLKTGRTLKVSLDSTSASTAFDGTANITDIGVSGTLAVANGGTGQTTAVNAANSLLNALSTGTSTPRDDDYYISQYVGGGTTTTTYHRRPVSKLYDYITGKADNRYVKLSGTSGIYGDLTSNAQITAAQFNGPLVGNVTGNADTATKLKTTITINGTNFDGSTAITTTQWGTTRSITIGDTTKSVNGSTDYNWTLEEIGAVNVDGDDMYGDLRMGTNGLYTKFLTITNGTNNKATYLYNADTDCIELQWS